MDEIKKKEITKMISKLRKIRTELGDIYTSINVRKSAEENQNVSSAYFSTGEVMIYLEKLTE